MGKEELAANEAVVDEKADEQAVDESGTDNAEVEADQVETVDAEPEAETVELSAAADDERSTPKGHQAIEGRERRTACQARVAR